MSELLTLSEIEGRARQRLPGSLWDFAAGGSFTETTLRRNRQALERLAIEQRILVDVRHVDLTTSLLGMTLPSPVIVAPMGGLFQLHDDGDLAMARGAGRAGGLSVVSGVCGWPVEEVASAASGPLMFQLYHFGDRAWAGDLLERVQSCGYRAICLTVDLAIYSRRERDIMNRHAGRTRHSSGPVPPDPSYHARLTWDDVDWLRQSIRVPFGLKGIMTASDAHRALQAGVDFLWVSNHGGRQLDYGRATVDALTEVAEAVDGKAPVIVDGGFRRGTDVIKGLALGATAVAMGRTILWGLAADGADGVERTLQLVNEEMAINLALAGRTSASQLPAGMIRKVDY